MAEIVTTATRVKYLDEKGKAKIVNETAFTSMNEEEGAVPVAAVATQTFSFHNVSDETPLDDLKALIADAAKQATVINRGLDSFQRQYSNRLMEDEKFAPTEGAFDLSVGLEAIGTRKAAPRKDVTALLGEMDAEKIAAILASLPQDKLEAIFSKLT